MQYSIILDKNELIYILVHYGVEDEEKYNEYGLSIEETTKENIEKGKKSLLLRGIISSKSNGVSYIKDDAISLVAITLNSVEKNNEYTDLESGLKVKFIKDEGIYLFKGSI
jgi:hypothetical protein